jgi:hypothetical protein
MRKIMTKRIIKRRTPESEVIESILLLNIFRLRIGFPVFFSFNRKNEKKRIKAAEKPANLRDAYPHSYPWVITRRKQPIDIAAKSEPK